MLIQIQVISLCRSTFLEQKATSPHLLVLSVGSMPSEPCTARKAKGRKDVAAYTREKSQTKRMTKDKARCGRQRNTPQARMMAAGLPFAQQSILLAKSTARGRARAHTNIQTESFCSVGGSGHQLTSRSRAPPQKRRCLCIGVSPRPCSCPGPGRFYTSSLARRTSKQQSLAEPAPCPAHQVR